MAYITQALSPSYVELKDFLTFLEKKNKEPMEKLMQYRKG